MNDFGKPIPKELCNDCLTFNGQAYCTMNCGPVYPKGTHSVLGYDGEIKMNKGEIDNER